MNVLHAGPGNLAFQSILVVNMFMTAIIPLCLVALAVYITVCMHKIKKSSEATVDELKEIHRILTENNQN